MIVDGLEHTQVEQFIATLQSRQRRSSFDLPWSVERVRTRAAMYIGDVYERGLHALIWEVVALSREEAHAGKCTNARVEICEDGSARVTDDGHAPL